MRGMFTTFQTDWDKSVRREISADAQERLPRNIKAFKAGALNPETLLHAVMIMRPPVQVVQIEVPKDTRVIKAARAFETVDRNDLIMDNRHLYGAEDSLQAYFKKFAENLAAADVKNLRAYSHNMVRSVVENFGEGAINEFMLLREETVNYNTFGFHTHVWDDKHTPIGKRAFYLSQALSDEPTYFVDAKDLLPRSLSRDALEAYFNKRAPICGRRRQEHLFYLRQRIMCRGLPFMRHHQGSQAVRLQM